MFPKGDMTLGSAEEGVNALVQNWGLRKLPGTAPFLQRRLHLWFRILPPAIDIEDPWAQQPSFDPYTFTLPTRRGPVAPARWARFRQSNGRQFDGETCDFMEPVYFRQEVLTKYETASGFEVGDDGSVSCLGEWGLRRSTQRLLEEVCQRIRDEFAPLAFLYDLRVHGGLAHQPNMTKAAIAAEHLGLPRNSWLRTDYLKLLNLLTASISQISKHLEDACTSDRM